MVNRFRSFLLEDEFKITISKDQIDIMNYSKIGQIDSNKIVIYYESGSININGKNLSLLKMLDDEILISGNIKDIMFN